MNKFFVRKILFGIVLIVLCSTSYGIEINLTKMLNPTNPSGSERMYLQLSPEKYPHSVIVLHYTVTTTVDQTVNTFYDRGVSSHNIVDRDGTIYQTVDWKNVAFTEGISYWSGNCSLNNNSIGIEQINTGDAVTKFNNMACGRWQLAHKTADGREWEIWPEDLVRSTAELVALLIEKYNIKPWNIIGHSDCACDRKIDPGPLFPWKRLHDEYNVGFWPEEDSAISLDQTNCLNKDDYMYLLLAFGYPIHNFIPWAENIEKLKSIWGSKSENRLKDINNMSEHLTDFETITSFQYHYMQDKFENDPTFRAGRLDDSTKLMILKCIKSIIKIADTDDYSIRVLKQMCERNILTNAAQNMVKSFGL